MLGLSLVLLTAAPVVRVDRVCPPGYWISGDYCVPRSPQSRPAIDRVGDNCPLGYFITPNYCSKAP